MGHGTDNWDVLGIIVGVGALVIILSAVGMFVWKKYKKKRVMQEKAVEVATTGGGATKIGDNQVASSYSPPPAYSMVVEDED